MSVTTLAPEDIAALQERAEAVHPDEPVASAREVLTLIHQLRRCDNCGTKLPQTYTDRYCQDCKAAAAETA